MATYGMRSSNVRIEKSNNNTYLVFADTERFGMNEIMYESYNFYDCIKWLNANGVDTNYIRIDALDEIDHIIHVSFCVDSYDIYYKCGYRQYKTGRNSLTLDEEKFMDTHKKEEVWIKNGGLKTTYTAEQLPPRRVQKPQVALATP